MCGVAVSVTKWGGNGGDEAEPAVVPPRPPSNASPRHRSCGTDEEDLDEGTAIKSAASTAGT